MNPYVVMIIMTGVFYWTLAGPFTFFKGHASDHTILSRVFLTLLGGPIIWALILAYTAFLTCRHIKRRLK